MSMFDFTLSKALCKIEEILKSNIPDTEENKKELNELNVIINQLKEEMYRHMPDHG